MTGGGRRDEPSVQFSLKELLKLEDERLEEQRRDAQAREAQAQANARTEALRKAAEAQAREEAIEKEMAAQKAAELDALARREAMQKAVVEQARLEVEARTRTQERELERRHEIELAKVRSTNQKSQLGSIAGSALLGGAVMLLVVAGIHFGATKPAADRRMAEMQTTLGSLETRVTEADRRAQDERKRGDDLQGQLNAANKKIAELSASTKGASSTTTTSSSTTVRNPTVGGTTHHVTPPPPPPPPVSCLKGDPLCPTIQ
jgi:hypothetical protein